MKEKLILFMVLSLFLITGCTQKSDVNKACTDSGGVVKTAMCCNSASDYPNTCLIGACGCSPDNSHEVKTCDCGEGKCFDGSSCVATESIEETCAAPTGESMTVDEARDIATASDCMMNATLKETYFCNENTGTWWFDLNLEKEGCNPACVVNVVTKQAEINWRCTGLIVP